MRCIRAPLLAAAVLLALHCEAAAADDHFYLRDGERVVFFGDSITQAGHYITYIEAFLLTRFPGQRFEIINHGISSETISGTSEPDHDPRRPWAHERFARDIAAWQPDVVVACFGMNDGNYHPPSEERFAAYQQGVRRLIERTREEAGNARLVLLTPPPYDAYRRKSSDENAVHYGYKFAYLGYDDVLAGYSKWLVTLRDEEQMVVDLHTRLNAHLAERRREQVSFYLAADAVHPGPTGHWLMAQTLLEAWSAPSLCATATVDAGTLSAVEGNVRDVRSGNGGALQFTWTSPLPMPYDEQWDSQSLELERTSERLNRYRLAVLHLPPGRYTMKAGRADAKRTEALATFTHQQWAEGIDLLGVDGFPTNKQAADVLEALRRHRQQQYKQWRAAIASAESAPPVAIAADESAAMRDLRALAQPQDIRIELAPAP